MFNDICHRSIALSGTTFENENMCHILKGLNKKQVRVCKRHVELMNSVKKGAEIAIAECQHQFKYRKWNCSTVNKNNEPVFGNALNKGGQIIHNPKESSPYLTFYFILLSQKGTRESAFVSALSAASVSYSVTKDCTSGQLKSCSCDTSLKRKQPQLNEENWRWAGCSDNVNFGNSFSKSFLDARIRERQDFSRARLLMNIHNNEAGRAVSSLLFGRVTYGTVHFTRILILFNHLSIRLIALYYTTIFEICYQPYEHLYIINILDIVK